MCWRANEEISCMKCYTSRYLETFLVSCFAYFFVRACTPAMGIGQDLALLSTRSYKITQAGTMNHGHWSVIAVISSTFHWVVVVYWRCEDEGFAQENFCLGEIPGGFIPSPSEWLFATSTQWLDWNMETVALNALDNESYLWRFAALTSEWDVQFDLHDQSRL